MGWFFSAFRVRAERVEVRTGRIKFIPALLALALLLGACSEKKEEFEDTTTTSSSTPLSAPGNLTATAGNSRNTLDWDNVSGASSYTVYWGTSTGVSSSSTAITSVSNDNYTHTGLTGGTTYYYKVAAVDSAGTGTLSSEASATALALMGGAIQGSALSLSAAVTTFAGTAGTTGTTDATGTAARFNNPYKITTDGTNLYVADYTNHTIRKIVISSGVVTTLAGTAGTSGTTNATGTSARFNSPAGLTTDGTNLYVAEVLNHTIRKIVISSGAVTTLAGTAGTSGTTNATGTAARFYKPVGLTTDGTNLYVADTYNHMIRKIVISTGAVTTLAGTAGSSGSTDGTGTSAKFKNPEGITTDGTNLYVAGSNHTIRKVVISSGVVTTLAGTTGSSGNTDGTGTSAKFYYPADLSTDGTNLYVADYSNHTIRKVVISTGVVTTIAGTVGTSGSADGTGTSAKFNLPIGTTTDGTHLYVVDRYNHSIRKIE